MNSGEKYMKIPKEMYTDLRIYNTEDLKMFLSAIQRELDTRHK